MRSFYVLCSLPLLALACATTADDSDAQNQDATGGNPVVHTALGDVRASGVKDGIARFVDLPYAAPPVGALRWKPPSPAAAWTGVRPAGQGDGASCETGEDCLYLDVYAPSARPSAPLPVLFFMHGGYGVSGSKAVIDGSKLAQTGNMIVVSTNYRLGALGYLTLPSLSAEQGGTSGNYAHLDQIAALQWVKANIAGFGGDPNRVTISGQSWGGMSTCMLMASPMARGLFSGAIDISGPDCLTQSKQKAYNVWRPLGDALDCPAGDEQLGCLRHLSFSKLHMALPNTLAEWPYGWRTVVDGNFLPDEPEKIFAAGRQNKVPLMIGTTSEESSSVGIAGSCFPDEGGSIKRWNEEKYESALSDMYGSKASRVKAHYPVASFHASVNGTASTNAAESARSDEIFVCPVRRIAKMVAAHQREPVYRYQFGLTGDFANDLEQPNGHGSDLHFAFRSAEEQSGLRAATKRSVVAVEDVLAGYYSRFVATGDPNGAGATSWAKYDKAKDNALLIDESPEEQQGIASDNCDFWDSLQ